MSATVYTTDTAEDRTRALERIRDLLAGGRTVVIPTDTVYGIAADAFSPGAVSQLLAAKGRSRTMPPPVLIADPGVLDALAETVPATGRALAERFWPGALTLIVRAQPSLNWDLGETRGTVALRVPADELTRELLRATGPLAVSSANRTGQTAATDAVEAMAQLGERVEAILDGGRRPLGRDEQTPSTEVAPSTIIDVTGDRPVVVRTGALDLALLRETAPDLMTREEHERILRDEDSARRADGSPDPAEDSRPGTEGQDAQDSAADGADAAPVTGGPGEGPRAGAPEPGSLTQRLLDTDNPSSGPAVDQLRTREAAAAGSAAGSAPAGQRVDPLPVERARALFFDPSARD
ncbi:L-threonylcarbamoyladenylate synthase [Rothia kristinae]|uniref:L-threonylcarbamoyladenylate synthase n=1 Tax=Rothia kristinae TaxID=37923 RepID=UPI0021B52942|nr:L-threonylcarbamoyladenylate synthase [Rothia kristinae]